MCRVLDIPRSTYYKFQDKTLSNRYIENEEYEREILVIYKKSSSLYRAPPIHKKLIEQVYNISIKQVQRLMKKLNMASIGTARYKPYSSKIEIKERENILRRDFTTKQSMKNG